MLWCLCQHRLDSRLKAHVKRALAGGGGELRADGGSGHCTVPPGLGNMKSERTQRDWGSADWREADSCLSSDKLWTKKSLSVLQQSSPSRVSAERPGQRKLRLHRLLNYTWLLILIACCIYFYEVLLKKNPDFLGSERKRSGRKDLLISINQVWERKKKYLKSLNWSPWNFVDKGSSPPHHARWVGPAAWVICKEEEVFI